MVQRPLTVYENLSGTARSAVDRALEGTKLGAMLRYAPRRRLGKRKFKLVRES
jgi:hypothetical protein